MKKQILTFKRPFSKLRNGEHIRVSKRFVARFNTTFAPLQIPKADALCKTYTERVNHEEMLEKPELASPQTPVIHASDERRKRAFAIIVSFVDVYAEYGDYVPTLKTAAQSLMHIVNNFRGTIRKSQTDATGLIFNMLEDLDKPEAKSAIATLSLTPAVEELRSANLDLDDAWDARVREEVKQSQHGTMAESRIRTDDALGDIFEFISAVYTGGMTGAYVLELMEELIDFANYEIIGVTEVLSHHTNLTDKPHKPSPGEDKDQGLTEDEDDDDQGPLGSRDSRK